MALQHHGPQPWLIALTTPRLILREWIDNQEDHDYMYNLESIPEVVRYQEWEPRSREEAAAVARTITENQSKVPRTHVELCVLTAPEKVDGVNGFVGRVGANVTYEDDKLAKADLWFAFLPAAQGKGFAREAVGALIEELSKAGVKRMEIECDPRNQGSTGLAERLGFTKVKEIEKAWESKGEWVGSCEYVKTFE